MKFRCVKPRGGERTQVKESTLDGGDRLGKGGVLKRGRQGGALEGEQVGASARKRLQQPEGECEVWSEC